MKSNSEARPSTVFLFYYTSIFTNNFTAAENWVSITRLSMKRWDDRSELRITEKLSLRFFSFWPRNINEAQGIRNHIHDWNPGFKVQWQIQKSTTWNPESTVWNPESKTVMDSPLLYGTTCNYCWKYRETKRWNGSQHNIGTLCCRLSPFIISPPMSTQVGMSSQAWILVNTRDFEGGS